MNNKKVILGVFIILIFIIILVGIILVFHHTQEDKVKGGENAHTMFDVDSDCILIKKDDRTTRIEGENRQRILLALRTMKTIGYDKKDNFDIEIDFDNGNIGYLASDINQFFIEGITYEIDKVEYDFILSLVE